MWTLVALVLLLSSVSGRVLRLPEYGGVEEDASGFQNLFALQSMFDQAAPGDTVLIPSGMRFHLIGGLQLTELVNITFQIDGDVIAVPDLINWPMRGPDSSQYAALFSFDHCEGLTVTGSGTIHGEGVYWWNKKVFTTTMKNHPPKLMLISRSTRIRVTDITLRNSPRWTLHLADVRDAEVARVSIHTDRSSVDHGGSIGWPELQPLDLNTDGIDVSGENIWVHDCFVQNADDSVAIKSCDHSCELSNCTTNVLIENMVLKGFGASIGSVSPRPGHGCVSGVTFRNISMPQTGKGIYIKSNPSCKPGYTGEISHVVFEDVRILEPRWWAIWIGPQQQHEPHMDIGEKCTLNYPISRHCPTQGCMDFRDILLKDVYIRAPWISPGVIMSNSTNPIQGLVFDNVTIDYGWVTGVVPFGRSLHCEGDPEITFRNSQVSCQYETSASL